MKISRLGETSEARNVAKPTSSLSFSWFPSLLLRLTLRCFPLLPFLALPRSSSLFSVACLFHLRHLLKESERGLSWQKEGLNLATFVVWIDPQQRSCH